MTLLYRPSSSISSRRSRRRRSPTWPKIGVKAKLLGVPSADFYTKYLQVPSVAKRGVWDLARRGLGAGLVRRRRAVLLRPVFSGQSPEPPVGTNYGFYNNPSVTALIDQAATSASASSASTVWAQADQKVMQDAPFYPITEPLQPLYHASYVHNAVYVPAIQQFDPTNVWFELARQLTGQSGQVGSPRTRGLPTCIGSGQEGASYISGRNRLAYLRLTDIDCSQGVSVTG